MQVNDSLKSVTTDVGKDDGYCACSVSGSSGGAFIDTQEEIVELTTNKPKNLTNLFTLMMHPYCKKLLFFSRIGG